MALDVNEVLANSIIGLIGLAASWIGARVNRFISKVNKAEKDLNAVFPKIRKIEKALGLEGGCDGGFGRDRVETGLKVVDGAIHRQGSGPERLGGCEENQAGV